ncbi:hypothetical protein AK830_g4244 [Neonectria ditissima]|uniref:Uncharacterized protein n=1 Tax=Neonectria ditissima TaxID=78410 RepID=A0A0P7BNS5_9HYPO|nr:hypothetical protein AK830_g4244 [Neonectria ditissima]
MSTNVRVRARAHIPSGTAHPRPSDISREKQWEQKQEQQHLQTETPTSQVRGTELRGRSARNQGVSQGTTKEARPSNSLLESKLDVHDQGVDKKTTKEPDLDVWMNPASPSPCNMTLIYLPRPAPEMRYIRQHLMGLAIDILIYRP